MSIVNSYSLWHVFFLAWFRITFDDISTIDFTVLYSYRVEDTPLGILPEDTEYQTSSTFQVKLKPVDPKNRSVYNDQ